MNTVTVYWVMYDPMAMFSGAVRKARFETENEARTYIDKRISEDKNLDKRFYIYVDTVDAENRQITVSHDFIYVNGYAPSV